MSGLDTTTIEELENRLRDEINRLEGSNTQIETSLGTITQAQSVCTSAANTSQTNASDSANSAAEALEYRNQTSEIAGLDDVAGAMGLLSQVYGTHDLDTPFNNGIDVTHGYGPVSFSRLSEATDINKSGQIQTFATDTPAITSKGCAFFGDLTTLNSDSDPKLNFGNSPINVAQTSDPMGGGDAITFTVDDGANRFEFTPTGLSVGDVVTVKWFEREDATGAPISTKLVFQTSVGCVLKTATIALETVNDYTLFSLQVEVTDPTVIIRLYFGISIGVGNSGYSFYNFWLIKGDIPDAPIITANGSLTERKGEVATIPQIGNLPRPGDPFYIVVDADVSGVPDNVGVVLGKLYSNRTYVGIDSSNRYICVPGDSSGDQGGSFRVARTKDSARVVYAIESGRIAIYEDGVLLNEFVRTSFPNKFFYSGDMFIGSLAGGSLELNGYLKNLKIEHGVMTDDLAKAYGKWGD